MQTSRTWLQNRQTVDNSAGETIRDVALGLNGRCLTKQQDFPSEPTLDEDIFLRRGHSATSTGNVFLTGATGFLGAFFLAELIQKTSYSVVCLVRAENQEQARDRVSSALGFYHLDDVVKESSRITPVPGDLRKPRFGLSEAAFSSIGQGIDRVYHVGADVNMILPYKTIKAANVQGTIEALRLACLRSGTSLHFVSTVGVFLSRAYAGATVHEDDTPPPMGELGNGYSQSKWVAEKLVREAVNRGLNAYIYRPTFIGWDSKTGAYNRNDFISALLCIALATGYAPALDMAVNLVPVDHVCSAILCLSNAPSHTGLSYHISNTNPTTWMRLVQECKEASFPIILEDYKDWRERIASNVTRHGFLRFLPMLPALANSGAMVNADRLSLSFYPKFDCRRALGKLKGAGIIFPCLEASLLAPHLNYIHRQILTSATMRQHISTKDCGESTGT